MSTQPEKAGGPQVRAGHTQRGAIKANPELVMVGENNLNNNMLWSIDFYQVATKKCTNFMAFITEFSDSFTSNWKSENVYGRMDPLQMFENTQRQISLTWTVISTDEIMAVKNLHKFEHLSSMLYPTYSHAKGVATMAASPLLKIRFTNLIADANSAGNTNPSAADGGLLGTVAGFTMTPNLEMGFYAPSPGVLLPKEYSVSCQFTVLHTHELGWSDDGKSKWRGPSKFPYGQDGLTGKHSLCAKGSGAPKDAPLKGKSKIDSKKPGAVKDKAAAATLGTPPKDDSASELAKAKKGLALAKSNCAAYKARPAGQDFGAGSKSACNQIARSQKKIRELESKK